MSFNTPTGSNYTCLSSDFLKPSFPTDRDGLTMSSPLFPSYFTFRDDMAIMSHPSLSARHFHVSNLFLPGIQNHVLDIHSPDCFLTILRGEIVSKARCAFMKRFVFSRKLLPEVIFASLCAHSSIYIWNILAMCSISPGILY